MHRGGETIALVLVGAIVLLAWGSSRILQGPTPTLQDPTWTPFGAITAAGALRPWGPADPGSYANLGPWTGYATYGTATG